MKLEEKIVRLRKERGWSQEELADRLDVSRQSVSKWEMGTSVPELDKIIAMGELFSVSLDYLLKEDAPVTETPPDDRVRVERDTVDAYLALAPAAYARIALAVSLCILSPVLLLFLLSFSLDELSSLSETAAVAWGVTVLLALVAFAVVIFIRYGMELTPYEYLKKKKLSLDEKTIAFLKGKQAEMRKKHAYGIGIGVGICVLSAVPLVATIASSDKTILQAVCLLLVACAVGVYLIVRFACALGVYDTLLSEGEYSDERKGRNEDGIAGIYWSVVTAAYLGISFTTSAWGITWVVWPCAAILYGAVSGIMTLARK